MQTEQQQIPAAEIRVQERRYQIAESRAAEPLAESIRRVGLLTPPILQAGQDGYIVISGFRRVRACLLLQWAEIPCRVLPPNTEPLDCLRIAIADNSLSREFTLGEQLRVAEMLRDYCKNARSLSALVTPLGLPIPPQLAEKLLRICRMPESVRDAAARGNLSVNTALAIEDLDTASVEAMAGVFDDLCPTVSQQQELFSGLNDIARYRAVTVATLLEEPAFAEILNASDLDRKRRLQLLRRAVHRRRYPALSGAEDAFCRHKRRLQMAAGMDLKPPANFEDTVYTMELRFSSSEQLCAQARDLLRICENPEMQAILNREIEDSPDIH